MQFALFYAREKRLQSDASSDANGHARRLFGGSTIRNSPLQSSNLIVDELGNDFDIGLLVTSIINVFCIE